MCGTHGSSAKPGRTRPTLPIARCASGRFGHNHHAVNGRERVEVRGNGAGEAGLGPFVAGLWMNSVRFLMLFRRYG